MSKKIKDFTVGKKVYVRNQWGPKRGEIDESYIYCIRSIGSKRAILGSVNTSTGLDSGRKGFSYSLVTKEEAESFNKIKNNYSCWNWSQFFVELGKEGWDTECNFDVVR